MKLLYKIYTLLKYYPKGKIKRLFRDIDVQIEGRDSIKHKNIIFCPFNPHQLNIVREGIWAHACRLRGAKVKMLSYDLDLPAIDFLPPGTKKDIRVSYYIVNKLYKILKLSPVYLSKYEENTKNKEFTIKQYTPEEIINLKHKGIKLGDLVIASTIRFFYCNGPEWDNPDFLQKAREFSFTAIYLTELFGKALDDHKPDKIVSSHGIYVSWGTLFRVARAKGIPVDIYSGCYRKNTLRFYHNTPNAPLPEGEWELFKDRKLSKDETKKIDDYILTRDTQSEDIISLFSDDSKLPDKLRIALLEARRDNKKICGLFTNISWDSYMYKKDDSTFSDMVEWVNENITYFAERTDSILIVKAHPVEQYYNVPNKYRIKSGIAKELPGNIIFLDEFANVKPVDLYNYINIGLVYISTVSLEMALRKIPVLTAGVGGHYSDRGFTIDPGTKAEYFKILEDLVNDKIEYVPDIDRAKNYLFFRFFGEALENSLLNIENFKIKEYKFNSIHDLLPGKHKELDIICNGILNDSKFIYQ